MIKIENITIGNKNFKKTYSDTGFIIQKIGTQEFYGEAIDLIDSSWEYLETNTPIEIQESE